MSKNKLKNIYQSLAKKLEPKQLLWDELLSKHTTFKIGGPADLFISPYNLAELCYVMTVLNKREVMPTILGGGSNVLVLDGGIRGVVVSLSELKYVLTSDERGVICAGAGNMLGDVAKFTCACEYTGLEFAVGIPGTIGGAIFMNAGAYSGEMSQVVKCVRTVTKHGQIKEYSLDECQFGYRQSVFQKNGEVIAEIELQLKNGDKTFILETMEDLTKRRESKQPLEWPSAGSTFKRPTGYYAGTLIEQTGLKGLMVGGAEISKKHAGFVINTGQATAKDVINLISEVQRRIKEQHGVTLETEVRIIGEK